MLADDFHMVTPEGEKGLWLPKQKQLITGNYVRAYLNTPPHLRQHGVEFFPGWNEDAQHIGEVTGLGPEAGAAIIAHLSPANESEKNRIQGMQLVHGVTSDKATKALIEAGEHAYLAKSAETSGRHARKHGDVGAASSWASTPRRLPGACAYARRAASLTPLSACSAQGRQGLLSSGDYSSPLDVGDFKLRPRHDRRRPGRVTLDTHMHDAGLSRGTSLPGGGRGLTSVNVEHFRGQPSARNIVNKRTSRICSRQSSWAASGSVTSSARSTRTLLRCGHAGMWRRSWRTGGSRR